jgi:hypothetical protein
MESILYIQTCIFNLHVFFFCQMCMISILMLRIFLNYYKSFFWEGVVF